MQFLVIIIHHLAGFLERHAPEDFQTVRGGELAEDRVRQCAFEALHLFCFFGGKFWVAILWVIVVGYENEGGFVTFVFAF